jgi:hypothetical protein
VPWTTSKMNESLTTAGWVPLEVVMCCKSMLKRMLTDGGWLPMDGGWLLTDGGWMTDGGLLTVGDFPNAAERAPWRSRPCPGTHRCVRWRLVCRVNRLVCSSLHEAVQHGSKCLLWILCIIIGWLHRWLHSWLHRWLHRWLWVISRILRLVHHPGLLINVL